MDVEVVANDLLYWCCKNCNELIVQHKDVHRVTNDFIYINIHNIDKAFYKFTDNDKLRIKCYDCNYLLDRGYVGSFVKFDITSVYFDKQ